MTQSPAFELSICVATRKCATLVQNSLATVLSALRRDSSVVIVNVEAKDYSLCRIPQHRWLDMSSDGASQPENRERLFVVGAQSVQRRCARSRQRNGRDRAGPRRDLRPDGALAIVSQEATAVNDRPR